MKKITETFWVNEDEICSVEEQRTVTSWSSKKGTTEQQVHKSLAIKFTNGTNSYVEMDINDFMRKIKK